MAMNPVQHFESHWDFYEHWSRATSDSAAEHRRFYDEYNAVLDMPGEYYLDNIRIVFQQHLLPRGLWYVGGDRVAPSDHAAALLTIEGEHDDISGPARPGPRRICAAASRRPKASRHRGGRWPLRPVQRAPLAADGPSLGPRLHRAGRHPAA
jgi:poly(3-hydroxybutyrate) depolymerase